jgi:ABC-type uncharacterized transport system permease subunit
MTFGDGIKQLIRSWCFSKKCKIMYKCIAAVFGITGFYFSVVELIDASLWPRLIVIASLIVVFTVSMFKFLKTKNSNSPEEYRALFPEG